MTFKPVNDGETINFVASYVGFKSLLHGYKDSK